METGEGIMTLITQAYTELLPVARSHAAIIQGKIYTFAAIGAILYIFGNLMSQLYYVGTEINFLPYLRPFVILMLLPMSAGFANILDKFADSIRVAAGGSNAAIVARIERASDKISEAVDRKWEIIGNDPDLYQKTFGTSMSEDESNWVFDKDLKLMMAKSADDLKIAIVMIVQNILIVLMFIAEAALFLLSMCYRLVLQMGFPITLTLCIFPGFTSALVHWFARYLNFALLPAIAALYSGISFKLLEAYLNTVTIDVNNIATSDAQNPDFLGYTFIGMLLLSLLGYFFVPSMTSMLITTGGVGQIISGTSKQGMRATGTLNRATGQLAGQVRSGVERAGKVAGAAAVGGYAAGTASAKTAQGSGASGLKVAAAAIGGAAAGAAAAGISKSRDLSKKNT